MQQLLPLACDGIPDAEYAVGYMYYYGLGVAQDTDVGYFWICRAAGKHYIVAVKALETIDRGGSVNGGGAPEWKARVEKLGRG